MGNPEIEKELEKSLRMAGYNPDEIKTAIGEQWVARVVTMVVDQVVNRPELFQKIVDGILNTIKQKL